MKIVGVICEYNPFHKGHKKQFDIIRNIHGPDTAIVCLMSGNYVQRGAPAIFDKMARAEAALCSGADLILELPITASLSSAEGFADRAVSILSGICDYLCFGTESHNVESLTDTAKLLLSPDFSQSLKAALSSGKSFPAARQEALIHLGGKNFDISKPNDILAIEYCKAIIQKKCSMEPMPIPRPGDYHDTEPDLENPSATAIRERICNHLDWNPYVPDCVQSIFNHATVHSLHFGERSILTKLRLMDEDQFAALPFGSEGLWRRFMHATRKHASVEDILIATKTKRYTRSRIDRMLMCAFLGITQDTMDAPVSYVRILGFNDTGRNVLRTSNSTYRLVNIGDVQKDDYQILENRCSDLYGLFANGSPELPGKEQQYRVIYLSGQHSNEA